MTWIRTASGAKFDYAAGADANINLYDIAEHLSKIPRFSGACRPNLSVAQHSIHVSILMERDGGSPVDGLIGLFHDGHEAYVGDLPTPFSDYLFELTGFDIKEKITEPIDEAIYRKLGIPYPLTPQQLARLRSCDKMALVAEGTQLVKGFVPDPSWPSCDLAVRPMGPDQAYTSFIERYNKLCVARQRWRTPG